MLREEATQELFEGYEFSRDLADFTSKKHTSFPTNSTEENVRRR
jgi:hypothetical protein